MRASKRTLPPALRNFLNKAKAAGYMRKGAGFKKLPRRGSAEYNRIMAG